MKHIHVVHRVALSSTSKHSGKTLLFRTNRKPSVYSWIRGWHFLHFLFLFVLQWKGSIIKASFCEQWDKIFWQSLNSVISQKRFLWGVQWGCSDWSPNEYLLLSFENILMGGLCAPLKCCSVLGFKQMCDKPNRVLPQHSVILYVTTTRPMKNMKVLKLHSCLCSGSKHNTWAYR